MRTKIQFFFLKEISHGKSKHLYTYQRFYVEEQNMTLRILRVTPEALNHQWRTFGLYLIPMIRTMTTVKLLQLVQSSLRRVSDRRQVSVTQTPEK